MLLRSGVHCLNIELAIFIFIALFPNKISIYPKNFEIRAIRFFTCLIFVLTQKIPRSLKSSFSLPTRYTSEGKTCESKKLLFYNAVLTQLFLLFYTHILHFGNKLHFFCLSF